MASVSDDDVRWAAPGTSSADFMPAGNGDIGLNVRTEPSGDVLFYIGKTDAWPRDMSKAPVAKGGRARVSPEPNPLAGNAPFAQALRLEDREIIISGGREAQGA